MKHSGHIFVLSLLMFATCSTAIAAALAKDSKGRAPSRQAPVVSIPWFCIKNPVAEKRAANSPSNGPQIKPIAANDRGLKVGQQVSVDPNAKKLVQPPTTAVGRVGAPPTTIKDTKEKPDKIPGTTRPGYSTPGYGSQPTPVYTTPGYFAPGTGALPGGKNTVVKDDGSVVLPTVPGYLTGNTDTGNTTHPTTGPGELTPDQMSTDWIDWKKFTLSVPGPCPDGYDVNYSKMYLDCKVLLVKKINKIALTADEQKKYADRCSSFIKSDVLSAAISTKVCAAYAAYTNACKNVTPDCSTDKLFAAAGVPPNGATMSKMMSDAKKYCAQLF